jgi:hypothetical protein
MKTISSITAASRANLDILLMIISFGFLCGFCLIIYQLFGRKPFKKNLVYNILIMLIAVILSQGIFYLIRKMAVLSN